MWVHKQTEAGILYCVSFVFEMREACWTFGWWINYHRQSDASSSNFTEWCDSNLPDKNQCNVNVKKGSYLLLIQPAVSKSIKTKPKPKTFKELYNISKNSGKFLVRRIYCTPQHDALMNRVPSLMRPIGWKEFPTKAFDLTLLASRFRYFQIKEWYQHNSTLNVNNKKLNLNCCWISENFWWDYFMKFILWTFTTFNCNSRNEAKAFKVTFEFFIVVSDFICSGPCDRHLVLICDELVAWSLLTPSISIWNCS